MSAYLTPISDPTVWQITCEKRMHPINNYLWKSEETYKSQRENTKLFALGSYGRCSFQPRVVKSISFSLSRSYRTVMNENPARQVEVCIYYVSEMFKMCGNNQPRLTIKLIDSLAYLSRSYLVCSLRSLSGSNLFEQMSFGWRSTRKSVKRWCTLTFLPGSMTF